LFVRKNSELRLCVFLITDVSKPTMEQTYKTKNDFNKIFANKGNIAPIAEKSHRNYHLALINPINTSNRLHHFAIGHAFKNMDTKAIFKYELNEKEQKLTPTQYLALQLENFDFKDELFKVIGNIRNINSHYVHTFDYLNIEKLADNKQANNKIIKFLTEAFDLSVLVNYLTEKGETYDSFSNDEEADKKIVSYLCEKFFPNKEHQKEESDHFLSLSKNKAIEHLLFIEVEEAIEWKLLEEHSIFSIHPGRYLSFHACLFLLSLFLYKDEANKLISKIKGFKRTEDQYSYKRNIFTLFSKKFSSQDINSEEKFLVRFRDIISYLNKYPTPWNKHLELESDFPKMTEQLQKKIMETEIFRSFPKYEKTSERKQFLQFATKQLFKIDFYYENFNFTDKEINDFNYQIDTSPELQKINIDIAFINRKNLLNSKQKSEFDKLKRTKRGLIKVPNPVKEKLLKRIKENTLYTSYGRNQDRFMQMAIRFLAEEHYFGEDAEFQLYQFPTTNEQEEYISELKNKSGQKSLDKLNYHQGNLTHYTTYKEHIDKYKEWDTPFVIQNNAFKLKIKLYNGTEKLLSVQRGLLIYFLEHALFHIKSNLNASGKSLLGEYFEAYQKEISVGAEILENNTNISLEQKNKLKRFFPKRLLHKYSPAQQNNLADKNTFELILEEAILQETRYKNLLENARKLNLEDQFIMKNKGKQFKLRFIRKVWQLMYFKEIYLEQAAKNGHHKSYNITKEEFNNFSRWIFAFDEVPKYKTFLASLFNQKQFFKNNEFKELFEQSTSLNQLYEKTKNKYLNWLENNHPKVGDVKYIYDNYKDILHKNQWYINIPHFIGFLQSKHILVENSENIIQYKALENRHYLVSDYYYKDQLNPDEYKTNGKLFNKLRSNKLEDVLLYELAVRYLQVDTSIIKEAKSHVSTILNSNVTFAIKNKTEQHLYNLIVPFNRLESLAVLLSHKIEQENDSKFQGKSFLENIHVYLSKINNNKDLKTVLEQIKKTGSINYEHLNAVYNHIISGSILFTRVEMKLEEYFITKHKISIPNNSNFIRWDEIKNDLNEKILKKYFDAKKRNKAFHFGVPDKDYITMIKEDIEKTFFKNEIKSKNIKSFDEFNRMQKSVCNLFMDILHNADFRKIKGGNNETIEEKKERIKKQRSQFEETYFNDMNKN
jgi:hypothetical protein